jgi:hypothetical protein
MPPVFDKRAHRTYFVTRSNHAYDIAEILRDVYSDLSYAACVPKKAQELEREVRKKLTKVRKLMDLNFPAKAKSKSP